MADVEFQNQKLKLKSDGELETEAFRATIRFDADARHSLSMTVTTISDGVQLRAGPWVERYAAKGVAIPDGDPLRAGETVELPASIYVNDTVAQLNVRSHYVRVDLPSPRPSPEGRGR